MFETISKSSRALAIGSATVIVLFASTDDKAYNIYMATKYGIMAISAALISISAELARYKK